MAASRTSRFPRYDPTKPGHLGGNGRQTFWRPSGRINDGAPDGSG